MKHIDLFSGIGGFALAAEWAGIETIVFCEIDEFCQKVLKKHWPNVPIISDIRDFDGGKYDADIITGGFPCQPFSVAGKRRSKEDDRYLWPEMLRVIKDINPRWVIGENVAGIISLALDEVLSDLEGAGYETQAFIIPACSLNAPHRRDRVWIIANRQCVGWQTRAREGIQSEIEITERSDLGNLDTKRLIAHAPSWKSGKPEARNGWGRAGRSGLEIIANPNESRLQRYRQFGECSRKQPVTTEAWQESWVEVATRLCRMDDGVPHRVDRLKALGNAIVPQVAYQIFRAIVEIENNLEMEK